jgi:GAF domain-containing protein
MESALPDAVREALRDVPTLELVSDVVTRTARTLTGAQGATFVLVEGDQCLYVDEDAVAPLWPGQRFPVAHCISGWAITHGEQVAVPEVFLDSRVPYEAYVPTFVRGLLMTPVGVPAVAAIGVYWSTPHRATEEQAAIVTELADAAGEALERIGRDAVPEPPWGMPPLATG